MRITLFIIFILQSFVVNAQEEDPWTVYMTPDSIHGFLSKYEGDFQMEMEMDGLDEPVKIGSTHKMILGGRFLTLQQVGKMMGMDYESIYTIGYNTIDHTMSMTTITNMGTGTLALQGKWDGNTQSATLYGTLTSPVSKQTIKVKQIVRFIDDDTLIIESFDKVGDNPEKKTLQYKFVRKQ
ncbi:DUF1579 family protein [Parapedobacter sp. 10938]|uniref:DUF1579 family protein n=1 Tax=Parapedobacter flavus TaxID=3110225 RepID=UPI002DB91569|nr:DUF1579 family protein [Parapedobacter sp. 10938]MEC3880237.1 DUF1579 family protein [Parapedobacter sp. 10938]